MDLVNYIRLQNELWLWNHRRNKERGPGPSNKEQSGEYKEQNVAKKQQIWAFWGVVFHENTSSKLKFRS